jgi:hypothetical protein
MLEMEKSKAMNQIFEFKRTIDEYRLSLALKRKEMAHINQESIRQLGCYITLLNGSYGQIQLI